MFSAAAGGTRRSRQPQHETGGGARGSVLLRFLLLIPAFAESGLGSVFVLRSGQNEAATLIHRGDIICCRIISAVRE